MFDLTPAVDRLVELVETTPDDVLASPTPCDGVTVAGLLAHIDGFAHAFALAARKETIEGGATFDPGLLGEGWRDRIPARLRALVEAWREPDAWTGMTSLAGNDFPGEVAAVISLDEVVLHSWDLAAATGRGATATDQELELLEPFVAHMQEPEMRAATSGLFGPPLDAGGATARFDRLLASSGRDPGWKPPA